MRRMQKSARWLAAMALVATTSFLALPALAGGMRATLANPYRYSIGGVLRITPHGGPLRNVAWTCVRTRHAITTREQVWYAARTRNELPARCNYVRVVSKDITFTASISNR